MHRFSIRDQFGGEMVCEWNPTPCLKAFADLYRNAPPLSQSQIESAINEAIEELEVTNEQAEAAVKREEERQARMIAEGFVYFLNEHIEPSVAEALNTMEKVIMALALDTVMNLEGGIKKNINDALNEQKNQAQARLRSGRGKYKNPFRFLMDLSQAMRCVEAGGNSVTQEQVAPLLGYAHASGLQKILDSHDIEWTAAVNIYQAGSTP